MGQSSSRPARLSWWTTGVASVTLAVLVATEQPLWTLVAVSLAIGTGNAMTAPALQSSIPTLVDRRDLAGAVSLNSISLNGSRVLGPGLAPGDFLTHDATSATAVTGGPVTSGAVAGN